MTRTTKAPGEPLYDLPGWQCTWSDDFKYRYTLWRALDSWPEVKWPVCQFICLNPSTADESANDPTVRRCINYARAWGASAFCMTNLFAYRATDPTDMKAQADPIGDENFDWIMRVLKRASYAVCAWGVDGAHQNAARDLLCRINRAGLADKLKYLRLNTISKQPGHPLYLPGNLTALDYSTNLWPTNYIT